MAPIIAPILYQETRLNLDPVSPASRILINLPSNSSSAIRSLVRRAQQPTPNEPFDEETFARTHLATESSIFFRRKSRYPRNILWRILEDRTLLELQSVDLTQDTSGKRDKDEALLTLALRFPSEIRPFGVAFADPEVGADAVVVFVLVGTGEVYTVTLRRDAFGKKAVMDESGVGEWCKIFLPSAFSFRYPYKLVAKSELELLISLHDGGLLRLERKHGEDGSVWRETSFSERWTSSLRGIIPWRGHNTVRFNDMDLEPQTALDIAVSPEGTHVFTACINHTLRAWNLSTGKIGVQTDLLGDTVDPSKAASYLVNPAQRQLVQMIDLGGRHAGDEYYVVTYSPKTHAFKVWAIRDADSAAHGIRDFRPDLFLMPPVDDLLNSTVWTMEEFHVKPGRGWHGAELWIRVRTGPVTKVFMLTFDLTEPVEALSRTWKKNWVAVDSGSVSVEGLRSNSQFPGEADPQTIGLHESPVADKWLDFLFYPGRFTEYTLETALNVFAGHNGGKQSRHPLKQRISDAVERPLALNDKAQSGSYQLNLATQWQMFYGVVKDLHKRRGEALSLVYDPEEGLPWITMADYVCPIRKASEIENFTTNATLLLDLIDQDNMDQDILANNPLGQLVPNTVEDWTDMGILLHAAKRFRRSFSSTFQDSLTTAVKVEVLQDPSTSMAARLKTFEERCSLTDRVGDDEYQRLLDDLYPLSKSPQEGPFENVSNDLVLAALDQLTQKQKGHTGKKQLTRFGSKTLIRGAQETLEQGTNVILDLLALVTFIATDVEEDDLADDFDPSELFKTLIDMLREHAVLSWLASHERQEPTPRKHHRSGSNSLVVADAQPAAAAAAPVLTLLESLFVAEWQDMRTPEGPSTSLITYWIRTWTFGSQIREQYDEITALVLGNLLKHNNIHLAANFVRYLRGKPWPTYLKARLHLVQGQYDMAAINFQKAAHGVAENRAFDIAEFDSAGLLNPLDRECFSDGLSSYYQHVLYLFEKLKMHSYVCDFAHLALQALTLEHNKPDDVKSELLSRLFSSSLATSDFEIAFQALTQHTKTDLLMSNLTSFLTALCARKPSLLLSLPTVSLHSKIDSTLHNLARKASSPNAPSFPSFSLSKPSKFSNQQPPDYHRLLYAYRMRWNDFRGAAQILYERLELLKSTESSRGKGAVGHVAQSEELISSYLELITVLSCLDEGDAWVSSELGVVPVVDVKGKGKAVLNGGASQQKQAERKRRLVTLEDVRRQYQGELDRVAALESGRFALLGGGEEDGDVDMF